MTESERFSPNYLIERYLRGELTESESDCFVEQLAGNKKILELVRAQLQTDAWLKELSHERRGKAEPEDTSRDFARAVAATETHNVFRDAASPEERRLGPAIETLLGKSRQTINTEPYDPFAIYRAEKDWMRKNKPEVVVPKKWKWNDYFLAICVVILVLMGIGLVLDSGGGLDGTRQAPLNGIPTVARVAELVEPIWAPGTKEYLRGEGLDSGELALDGGLAKVEFRNGVVVLLEAPVRFSVQSELETSCLSGRVSVTISKQATGFTVGTPFGSVVDRGTVFCVEVTPSGTDVETVKGQVDLVRDFEFAVPIVAGQRLRCSRDGETTLSTVTQSRFLTEETFVAKVTESVRREMDAKKQEEAALRRDPNLLARFVLGEKGEQFADNLVEMEDAPASGIRFQGATTTPGQLYGSKALFFGEPASTGTLSVSGQYDDLTLKMVVRIDQLNRNGNVLFASENYASRPGAILVQITHDGRFQLQIRNKRKAFEYYQSSPVVTRELLGTWREYTVSVNTKLKRIALYVDGRGVSLQQWRDPIPLVFGEATVGNVVDKQMPDLNRSLGGALSEIKMFDR